MRKRQQAKGGEYRTLKRCRGICSGSSLLFLTPCVHHAVRNITPFAPHAVRSSQRSHLVRHAASGLHNVADADLGGVIDAVAEGEEGVGGEDDAVEGGHVLGFGLGCEGWGNFVEVRLPPDALLGGEVALDVADAGVDAVLPLDPGLEAEGKDRGVLPEGEGGDLAAGELTSKSLLETLPTGVGSTDFSLTFTQSTRDC